MSMQLLLLLQLGCCVANWEPAYKDLTWTAENKQSFVSCQIYHQAYSAAFLVHVDSFLATQLADIDASEHAGGFQYSNHNFTVWKTDPVVDFFVDHLSSLERNIMSHTSTVHNCRKTCKYPPHLCQVAPGEFLAFASKFIADEQCLLAKASGKSNSHLPHSLAVIDTILGRGRRFRIRQLAKAPPAVKKDWLRATACSTARHFSEIIIGACSDWKRSWAGNRTEVEVVEEMLRQDLLPARARVVGVSCEKGNWLPNRLQRDVQNMLLHNSLQHINYVYYTEADQVVFAPAGISTVSTGVTRWSIVNPNRFSPEVFIGEQRHVEGMYCYPDCPPAAYHLGRTYLVQNYCRPASSMRLPDGTHFNVTYFGDKVGLRLNADFFGAQDGTAPALVKSWDRHWARVLYGFS